MLKMREVDLSDSAVKYAGNYIADHFKKGSEVDKHLILNTIAHGFFMGARWREKLHNYHVGWKTIFRAFTKVDPEGKIPDEMLVRESIKASTYYLKKKEYSKLEFASQALIRASLSKGFQEGFRFRESSP